MSTAREDKWWLGGSHGDKIVHVASCRHARAPYHWANEQGSARQVAEALIRSGAIDWHRACRVCNQELIDAILDSFGRVPVSEHTNEGKDTK